MTQSPAWNGVELRRRFRWASTPPRILQTTTFPRGAVLGGVISLHRYFITLTRPAATRIQREVAGYRLLLLCGACRLHCRRQESYARQFRRIGDAIGRPAIAQRPLFALEWPKPVRYRPVRVVPREAAASCCCSGESFPRFDNRETASWCVTHPFAVSKPEAKPDRGIDRIAIEVAVRQSAVDLRVHEAGVGVKLLLELPIGGEREGVERPVAVRR